MVDKSKSEQYKKQFFGDMIPDKFHWHSVGDEEVCSVCERFNDRVFNMEDFDFVYPPHDGCRCTLEPVIDLTESIKKFEANEAKAKLQKKKPFWRR